MSKIKPSQSTHKNFIPLIPLVGMFQCLKKLCLTCQFVEHDQKYFTAKGKTYTFRVPQLLQRIFGLLFNLLLWLTLGREDYPYPA